ncbi:MAG: DUF721 domain-containing protein [Actinobacteria bacterium]|nr:DUF721 domain-containing protein [Actinomycetota bacterium]
MNDPAGLSRLLNDVVKGLGGGNPLEQAKIFSAWESIVGRDIAIRCQPTSLKAGVLKVKADSPIWASEFKYLAPKVIDKLNLALGGTVVTEIRPWVPAAPEADRSRRKSDKAERRPRPTEFRSKQRAGSPTTSGAAITDLTQDREETSQTPDRNDLEEAEKVASTIPDGRLAESLKRALLAGKMRQRKG